MATPSDPNLRRPPSGFVAGGATPPVSSAGLPNAQPVGPPKTATFFLEGNADGSASLGTGQPPDVSDTADTPDIADPAHLGIGIPQYIGRFHIKRFIGHGGMGSVYEAVQEQPRRVVALKVMRTGTATRSALRRFMYESQLLARLRHVGIAQVFDAGTHIENGVRVPYFAMEYIVGARSLTEFAEQRDLSTDQRVELFMKVCDAVHHGHQKGIVHRDLKPANILVDSQGNPKIIDFGVARATDSDMAVTTQQTDVGSLIGTLQYMSPEQVAADPHDIDTRSDVYSMGIVLYELVCRQLPYDCAKCSVPEAVRIVREQSPARPSSVSAFVRRDLEVIILKAVEKDRDRRYRSAADLADDLRRYLASEAVSARPASLAHQFKLFARRNRAVVVAGSIACSALLAATLISSFMAFAARRDNAKLKQFTEFTSVALGTAQPATQGESGTGLSLEEAAGLVSVTFGDAPLAEARVRLTLAQAHAERKQWALAEQQARLALARLVPSAQLGVSADSRVASAPFLLPTKGYAAQFQAQAVDAAAALARALIEQDKSAEATAVLAPIAADWKSLDNDTLGHFLPILDVQILAYARGENWPAAKAAALNRLAAAIRLHSAKPELLVRPLHNVSILEGRIGQLREARAHYDQAELIRAGLQAAGVDEYQGPRDLATDAMWPRNARIGLASVDVLAELHIDSPPSASPPPYEIEVVARAVRDALRGGPLLAASATADQSFLAILHEEITRAWLGFEAQAASQRQPTSPAGFRAYVRTNAAWTALQGEFDRIAQALNAIERLALPRFVRWRAQHALLARCVPTGIASNSQQLMTLDQLDECIRGPGSAGFAHRAAWKALVQSIVLSQTQLNSARTAAQTAYEQSPSRTDYLVAVGVAQFRLAMRAKSQDLGTIAKSLFRDAAGSFNAALLRYRERPQDRRYGGEEIATVYLAGTHLAGSALPGVTLRRDTGLILLGQVAAALRVNVDDAEALPVTLAQIELLDQTMQTQPPISAAELEQFALRYTFREMAALAEQAPRVVE